MCSLSMGPVSHDYFPGMCLMYEMSHAFHSHLPPNELCAPYWWFMYLMVIYPIWAMCSIWICWIVDGYLPRDWAVCSTWMCPLVNGYLPRDWAVCSTWMGLAVHKYLHWYEVCAPYGQVSYPTRINFELHKDRLDYPHEMSWCSIDLCTITYLEVIADHSNGMRQLGHPRNVLIFFIIKWFQR